MLTLLHMLNPLQTWNNLPEVDRSADTLASFKHLLTLDTSKVPKYYRCCEEIWNKSYLHVLEQNGCSKRDSQTLQKIQNEQPAL